MTCGCVTNRVAARVTVTFAHRDRCGWQCAARGGELTEIVQYYGMHPLAVQSTRVALRSWLNVCESNLNFGDTTHASP